MRGRSPLVGFLFLGFGAPLMLGCVLSLTRPAAKDPAVPHGLGPPDALADIVACPAVGALEWPSHTYHLTGLQEAQSYKPLPPLARGLVRPHLPAVPSQSAGQRHSWHDSHSHRWYSSSARTPSRLPDGVWASSVARLPMRRPARAASKRTRYCSIVSKWLTSRQR